MECGLFKIKWVLRCSKSIQAIPKPGNQNRHLWAGELPSIMKESFTRVIERELTIADLKFDPPRLPASRLQEIAKSQFGVSGAPKVLDGERDQNCRIIAADGRQYVLKISAAGVDPAVIDFQIEALLHIERADPGIPVPRMVRSRDGELRCWISTSRGRHQVRMLSYLPGIPYQQGPAPSLSALYQVGAFLARLNRALRGFSHPAAGHFMPWDITNGLVFKGQLREMLSDDVHALVTPTLRRLEHEVYPLLPSLRRQVIHQDGHGANLLRESVHSDKVVGIIDFGDMVYGPLICDLAVSLADFIDAGPGPVEAAAAMCRGFQSVLPLQSKETDLLLDLVVARQILILELFEFRRRKMRRPPRFVITDQPAIIASLNLLTGLDRVAFNEGLREAME